MPPIVQNNDWWREFLDQDVKKEDFTEDQNALFETYQLSQDQKRIFQCVKTGKNLFLSDLISDEKKFGALVSWV